MRYQKAKCPNPTTNGDALLEGNLEFCDVKLSMEDWQLLIPPSELMFFSKTNCERATTGRSNMEVLSCPMFPTL